MNRKLLAYIADRCAAPHSCENAARIALIANAEYPSQANRPSRAQETPTAPRRIAGLEAFPAGRGPSLPRQLESCLLIHL